MRHRATATYAGSVDPFEQLSAWSADVQQLASALCALCATSRDPNCDVIDDVTAGLCEYDVLATWQTRQDSGRRNVKRQRWNGDA